MDYKNIRNLSIIPLVGIFILFVFNGIKVANNQKALKNSTLNSNTNTTELELSKNNGALHKYTPKLGNRVSHLNEHDSNSNERVTYSKEQFKNGDNGYKKLVEKHIAVSMYKASTRKDDEIYKNLLIDLYKNGYGIEFYGPVGSAIIRSRIHIINRRKALLQKGLPQQEIEQRLKQYEDKILNENYQDNIERFIRMTGIDDVDYINSLLKIPLNVEDLESPLGYGRVVLDEGDELLTDDDWMPDYIQDTINEFGEPSFSLKDINERVVEARAWKMNNRSKNLN